MFFFKRVYKTNRFDFSLIAAMLLFYIFLHIIKVSTTPLHLFAMYSQKAAAPDVATSYRVFLNDEAVDLSKYNMRREHYLLRVLRVYGAHQKNNGTNNNRVYDAIHKKLPFLRNREQEKELYTHPDHKEQMSLWLQEYFDCENCNTKIYKYNISLDKNLDVNIIDSIQIL